MKYNFILIQFTKNGKGFKTLNKYHFNYLNIKIGPILKITIFYFLKLLI